MRRHDFDQELAEMREGLPRIWYSLYQGCLSAGFDKRQSMVLVQTFILGSNVKGNIIPDSDTGPESDKGDS